MDALTPSLTREPRHKEFVALLTGAHGKLLDPAQREGRMAALDGGLRNLPRDQHAPLQNALRSSAEARTPGFVHRHVDLALRTRLQVSPGTRQVLLSLQASEANALREKADTWGFQFPGQQVDDVRVSLSRGGPLH
jgi:hypothetical protein